jgi:hypothetical protein
MIIDFHHKDIVAWSTDHRSFDSNSAAFSHILNFSSSSSQILGFLPLL